MNSTFLSPVKILLIESDLQLTLPLHNILLTRQLIPSFDFTPVSTLSDAFKIMGEKSFELILMDMDPKSDPELTDFHRLREINKSTPIIALLADKHASHALHILDKGVHSYLLKSQINSDTLPGFLWRNIEKHAHDHAVRQSERRFRSMIENASDIVLVMNDGGLITFASPSIETFFKISPDELIGKNALDYFHRDDRSQIHKSLEHSFLTGQSIPFFQARFRSIEKGWIPIEGKGRIVIDQSEKRVCVLNCHDVTHRVLIEEELRTLSLRDELTGLHNRRSFVTFIDQQLKIAQRTGKRGLCLLMLDLDGFKTINDTLGHKVGDRALVDAARILQNTFRDADIIARLGGDEFVVFLTETIENIHVEALKKRLHDGVDAWNNREQRQYRLAMSVGAVHHNPVVHRTPEDFLIHADELMYQQKRERKRQNAMAIRQAGPTAPPPGQHPIIQVDPIPNSNN